MEDADLDRLLALGREDTGQPDPRRDAGRGDETAFQELTT